MESIQYIVKFFYRIRLYLVIIPLIATLFMIYKTKNMSRTYEVSSTLYTGVASGFNIESEGNTRTDWPLVNNAMDNLIGIIKARSTLERVSLRLYAQSMIFGDETKDNNHIQANTYKALLSITPKDVLKLIDKNSEEKTISNLKAYSKADAKNFVYGLFNWYHPHYSFTALSLIEVKRASNSDMLELKYSANDPGIAYNTLKILNEEFVGNYQELRFGETNDVIKYFEGELSVTGSKLRNSEDSLTQYYVENKIINYIDQTKEVAAISKEYDLSFKDILLSYNSSKASLSELEKRIDSHILQLKDNTLFISKLQRISDLTTEMVHLQAFNSDSTTIQSKRIEQLKNKIQTEEQNLVTFTDQYNTNRYTKEGVSSSEFITPWMEQLLKFTKSEAELNVMNQLIDDLNNEYAHFAPIGSTLKRKEREISFTEQTYLSLLSSLNAARLRQKNLQMSSASLKVLNEPVFPVDPLPTKRKALVAGTYFGTFMFILGFFILLELIDRTLRDKIRTERITNGIVVGAFPAPPKHMFRGFQKDIERIATISLFNTIHPYLKKGQLNIVNFISIDHLDGKSYIVRHLEEYLNSIDYSVQSVNWNFDDKNHLNSYLKMENLDIIRSNSKVDLCIIEHPTLKDSSIPTPYLKEAALNLIVARADKGWTETHQILFNRLKLQVDNEALFIYLNRANRQSVEAFTGMLPPYTKLRKLFFKFSQLALTER